MFVFVLLLGVLAVVLGGLSCGYGFLINEFSLGNTLLVAGAIGVVGGLILIAVAGVIRQLRRIGDGLADLRLPAASAFHDLRVNRPRQPPAPEVMPPAPEPQVVEPRLDAAPPVRSDPAPLVDPFAPLVAPPVPAEPAAEPATLSGAEPPPIAPSVEPQLPLELESIPLSPEEQEPLHGSHDERDEPSFEQLPEPRSAAAPAPHDEAPAEARQRASFDTIWPRRGRRADRMPAEPEPEAFTTHEEAAPPASEPEPIEQAMQSARDDVVEESEAASAPPHPISILKSGVVDGMAYTLYSDGSIEAELPTGTIRFASINELREHLEKAH